MPAYTTEIVESMNQRTMVVTWENLGDTDWLGTPFELPSMEKTSFSMHAFGTNSGSSSLALLGYNANGGAALVVDSSYSGTNTIKALQVLPRYIAPATFNPDANNIYTVKLYMRIG